MIRISKSKAFNADYILVHISSIVEFVKGKKQNFGFFGYNFNIKSPKIEDLLRAIAYDPFSFQKLDSQSTDFLSCYQEIADFLLHSQTYFDLVKASHEIKKGSRYLTALKDERKRIISKFESNNIVKGYLSNKNTIIKNESNYNSLYQKIKSDFILNNITISNIFNYSEYLKANQTARNSILNNINIKVCPYCNRQFIDTYSIEGKIKSVAQIDHFYPKKLFPLYSLSLLNFVPSCSYCNCSIKKDRLFPWSKIYHDTTLNQRIFTVEFHNLNGIYGNQNYFDLKMDIKNEDIRKNSSFFRHEHIYKNHKVDISELLKRRVLFNNVYKKSLEKCLSEKINESDFKKIIFGVSGLEDDYTSIPLSKLKNDIINELE